MSSNKAASDASSSLYKIDMQSTQKPGVAAKDPGLAADITLVRASSLATAAGSPAFHALRSCFRAACSSSCLMCKPLSSQR